VEFAFEQLGVEHVVVCGHAHCSGVKAMVSGREGTPVAGRFVPAWTSIVDKAYTMAKTKNPAAEGAELARCCERQAVLVSLDNLMTFPFIRERVEARKLGNSRLVSGHCRGRTGPLQPRQRSIRNRGDLRFGTYIPSTASTACRPDL